MKHLLKSISFFTITFLFGLSLSAQVSTQDRQVGDFTGIYQHTSADIYITKGDTETVTVKADSDAIDKLTTEVRDGVLHIESTRDGWRNVRTMEVHITMRSLDKIKNSGSGDFSIRGPLSGKDMYIGISGSGDLDAELEAINLEIKISGSGDINLSGVRGNLNISISGSGDVYAEGLQLDECNLAGYGSGDVKLKGRAAHMVAQISGSGDINAYGLTAVDVKVKCNGSGDVVVKVVERVSAVLNGSGDLTYYGTPEYVDVESNGSGDIYRK